MDKYEFNIKVEQIKKLVNRGDYETAMKIADTIDWRRVRNASLLSMIAQVYEKNDEYQEAKDILLLAFERAPIGKRLLYKLAELALKEGSVAEAEAYYREFCDLAQDDPRQYLLRYLILKVKKAPADQLIRALETYTATEVDEKWLYELAELYHQANMEDACVRTCDKIMLLFGLGKYVDKAMDLKLLYAPLNKYQMDLVENRDKYEAKLRAIEEEYSGNGPEIEDYEESQPPVRRRQETDVEKEIVMKLHEDVEAKKLAKEMSRISDDDMRTAEVEEDMDATRPLEDIKAIKDIKPTRRVLDAAAEREAEELAEADREIERQREAIRAAKEREEMEEEALRRAEEEREAARRAEEERRLRKQAEIDRERARSQKVHISADEEEDLEMESLDDTLDTNHLMIEADSSEQGLALALDALREIHRDLGYKNPVAKISSEKLNKKGIRAVAEKLAGKDLIVEQAADLSDAVQNELDELMEKDKSGMIVVLIDTPQNLEYLHGHNASLASKFQYIGTDVNAQERRLTEAAVEQALKKETQVQEHIAKEVVQQVADPQEPAMDSAPEEAPDKKLVKFRKERPASHSREEQADYGDEEAEAELRNTSRNYEEDYEEDEESEANYQEDRYDGEKYDGDNYDNAKFDGDYEKEDYKRGGEAGRESSVPADYNDQTEMDLDEFAQYACKYALEIDCSITGKSLLALYERIEMMEEDGVPLTKKTAVDLIEEAADKAEKPSLGKKITGLFSPKYDKEGLLILREDNFFD